MAREELSTFGQRALPCIGSCELRTGPVVHHPDGFGSRMFSGGALQRPWSAETLGGRGSPGEPGACGGGGRSTAWRRWRRLVSGGAQARVGTAEVLRIGLTVCV